jgi:phage/plasmid-like protein (TIGR03299 family)
MPALVETMFSARELPWHGLGHVVPDVLTAKEALEITGLDFEPLKVPLYARLPDGSVVLNEKAFAVVRSTDNKIIGSKVGSYWTGNAPRDVFDLLDNLVDDGSAKYETFGTLKDGSMMFVTMQIPQEILIGGVDPVAVFIAVVDSYDGSSPFRLIVTPVRIVCTNTASLAIGQAQRIWKVRHTANVQGKLEEARRSIGLTFKYVDEFEKEMEKLIHAELTMSEAEKIVRQVVPGDPEEGRLFTDSQSTILDLFQSSPTLDDSFRQTKYGLFQSVSEFSSWIAPLSRKSKRSDNERLTEAIWFGSAVDLNQKAYSALTNA